jgi:hypothetical protein
MPSYQEPLHEQPEFDDVGPLGWPEKLFLRVIGPFLQAMWIVTMPGQVKRTNRTPVGYQGHRATDEDWAKLPPRVRAYFDETQQALARHGFGTPRLEVTPTSTAATAYTLLLFEPSTKVIALLVAGVSPRRFVYLFVSLQTWWDDGSRTSTTNTDEVELGARLSRPHGLDTLTLPGMDDIDRLFRIHRRRMAERSDRRAIGGGWDDRVDNPLALIRRAGEAWEGRVVESGLMTLGADGHLRPTWKGAILMTWSRLQPFRGYLAWRARRRAARALERFEGA